MMEALPTVMLVAVAVAVLEQLEEVHHLMPEQMVVSG